MKVLALVAFAVVFWCVVRYNTAKTQTEGGNFLVGGFLAGLAGFGLWVADA